MELKTSGRQSGRTTRMLLTAMQYQSENPTHTVFVVCADAIWASDCQHRVERFWPGCPIKFLSDLLLRDCPDPFRGYIPGKMRVFYDHYFHKRQLPRFMTAPEKKESAQ